MSFEDNNQATQDSVASITTTQTTMSRRQQPPIPKHVREQVDRAIDDFNQQTIKNPDCFYLSRYHGSYLYLDRHNYGPASPIARLKYQDEVRNWEFAIYKYSNERYDPDEGFFPGVQHIDGTVEGAMKAGLEAYPLSDYNNTSMLGRVLSLLTGRKQ